MKTRWDFDIFRNWFVLTRVFVARFAGFWGPWGTGLSSIRRFALRRRHLLLLLRFWNLALSIFINNLLRHLINRINTMMQLLVINVTLLLKLLNQLLSLFSDLSVTGDRIGGVLLGVVWLVWSLMSELSLSGWVMMVKRVFTKFYKNG